MAAEIKAEEFGWSACRGDNAGLHEIRRDKSVEGEGGFCRREKGKTRSSQQTINKIRTDVIRADGIKRNEITRDKTGTE